MTVEAVFQDLSPLSEAGAPPGVDVGDLYHRSSRVYRFALVDSDAPPLDPKITYFAPTTRKIHKSATTGRYFKKPRTALIPGAEPGTIAFVDFHATPPGVYIDYLVVRPDLRTRKLGYTLVEAFYRLVIVDQHVEFVNWGRVLNDRAWSIMEKMQSLYPNVYSFGHRDF